jgi:hypothetical protein
MRKVVSFVSPRVPSLSSCISPSTKVITVTFRLLQSISVGPRIVTFCGKVNSLSHVQPVVAFCLTCFEPSIGSVILATPKVSPKSSGLEAILPSLKTSPPAEMKCDVIMNGRIQHLNLDYVLRVPIYVIDVTVPRQNASGAHSPCSIWPKRHIIFF